MAGVLGQLLVAVLISQHRVQANTFGFGSEESMAFINADELSNAPISGLSEFSDGMFEKSDVDSNLLKLQEAVEELKKRLQELENQKADLLKTCNDITTAAQAATQSAAANVVAVDTSNVAVTSELQTTRTKIVQLQSLVETLVSKQTIGNVIDSTESDVNTDLSQALASLNDYSKRLADLKAHVNEIQEAKGDGRPRIITQSQNRTELYYTQRHHSTANTQVAADETKVGLVCPSGFEKIRDHCYGTSTLMDTYTKGAALCSAVGAYLVQPESMREWEDVKRYLYRHGADSVYIGLTDMLREGRWTWTHGGQQLVESMNRQIWSPQQPDNWVNSEHVIDMVIWQGYTFNDLNWRQSYAILCEVGEPERNEFI